MHTTKGTGRRRYAQVLRALRRLLRQAQGNARQTVHTPMAAFYRGMVAEYEQQLTRVRTLVRTRYH
jgi:hypothetical protein